MIKMVTQAIAAFIIMIFAVPSKGNSKHKINKAPTQFQVEQNQTLTGEWHTTPNSKSAVILIHGLNEFYEMHLHVAEYLSKEYMLDSLAYSVRGHGKIGLENCHIEDFTTHIKDLHQIVTKIQKELGYENIHLIGHSTGGLITLLFLSEYSDLITSAAVVSPYLNLNQGWFRDNFAKPASRVFSSIPLMKENSWFIGKSQYSFENNPLTRDFEYYHKFKEDPRQCGRPTWGWLNASFNAQEKVQKGRKNIKTPFLTIASTEDRIVSTQAIEEFCMSFRGAKAKGMNVCELVKYKDVEHSILMEKNRNKIFDQIGSFFLLSRLESSNGLIKPK